MSLRPATAADVPAVAQLVDDAYGHYVERIGRPPGPMLDDHEALVAEGFVHVLDEDPELEQDGAPRVVGVLVLVDEPDALLIANVAVAPAAQGRGLGRLLMTVAEERARALGHDTVRLYTHVLMVENIALYTRLGYVETGRRTEDGLTRVFMEKTLETPPETAT